MQNGDVRDAQVIADESKPIVRRLKPAIEWFLAACVVKQVVGAPTVNASPTTPPGFDSNVSGDQRSDGGHHEASSRWS